MINLNKIDPTYLIFYIGITILLFLIFREITCWYLKQNKIIKLLESIDLKLKRQIDILQNINNDDE